MARGWHYAKLSLSNARRLSFLEMAIFRTWKWLFSTPVGCGVFSYLPHHLDLALEDSVGHSTCMSVLACRRAIMGWLVG